LQDVDEGELRDTGAVIDIIVAFTDQARLAAGNITP
jgi:hypothetical protein